MPSIRFPSSVEALFPLSRTEASITEDESQRPFKTNAHLLRYCACFGYWVSREDENAIPNDIDFLSKDAVDLNIFRRNGLLRDLIIIAMDHTDSVECARDEDTLCKIVEAFVHLGAQRLGSLVKEDEGDLDLVAKALVEELSKLEIEAPVQI